MTKRCGVVAIVGEPNAGKSTLVNQLVGGKISIVTPKVQTTRFNIRGVCAQGESQLIFVDTPGIFDADKRFEKAMVNAAWAGIGDSDCALILIDAKVGITSATKQLFTQLKGKYRAPDSAHKPLLLAINKIDKVPKEKLFALAKACDAFGVFDCIFMISAKRAHGTDDVKAHLAGLVPLGPWHYPEDQMSDISLRLLAAEITREKLFLKLDQELPYAIFVETEAWEESEHSVKISQVIFVQREGQKKIVIGEGGAMIKAIGIAARRELEKMIEKKIHITLFVKVSAGWKDDSEHYRALGLEYRK